MLFSTVAHLINPRSAVILATSSEKFSPSIKRSTISDAAHLLQTAQLVYNYNYLQSKNSSLCFTSFKMILILEAFSGSWF